MNIREYLLDKGIEPHLKGFVYLETAIKLCHENEYLAYSTMQVYDKVAKEYGVDFTLVERNIRYALQKAKITGHIRKFILYAVFATKK